MDKLYLNTLSNNCFVASEDEVLELIKSKKKVYDFLHGETIHDETTIIELPIRDSVFISKFLNSIDKETLENTNPLENYFCTYCGGVKSIFLSEKSVCDSCTKELQE